jgi:hypothetical protein
MPRQAVTVPAPQAAASIPPASLDIPINLLDTVQILNTHLTEALCDQVFENTRDKERQREWSLHMLGQFWTAVCIHAPSSLGHALERGRSGAGGLWPTVNTTDAGYFQRAKNLPWKFFHALYYAFTQKLLAEAEPVFGGKVSGLRARFPNLYLVDGSRLDAIAHKMEILWDNRAVVLPGCLTVFYDLYRGVTRQVLFDPDAASAELLRAVPLLSSLPKGSLIVGDRLYASIQFFWQLSQRGLWGLFRLNGRLTMKRQHLISRRQGGGRTVIEEWLVLVGTGQTAPPIMLRWISFRQGKVRKDLLTNILDPEMLTAEEALDLYPLRWTIERVFYDLKEVLGLQRFYAANPNAVAQQVYAAAMVHNAFRIAQARIAKQCGVAPEAISTAKLFPKLAEASANHAGAEEMRLAMRRLNPGVRLREPAIIDLSFGRTTLGAILLRKRSDNRRVRRFCKARRRWKSLAHVRGGPKLIKLA